MKQFNIASGLRTLHEQRELLHSLVVRDLIAKYKGTALGYMWAILTPLLMLTVYASVFGGIFKTRLGTQDGSMADFIPRLYCGMIVFGLFSETIARAPGAVLAHPGYVRKVLFPLELIPLTHLVTATVNAGIGLVLLVVFMLVQRHTLAITVLLIPLLFLPLLLFTIGCAWFFAAVGVFFRDLGQIVGLAMSILLFLSPVFYSSDSVMGVAKKLLFLNPLTYPIEELRKILLTGAMLDWHVWVVYTVASSLVFLCGLWTFQRTRHAFADVI